MAKKVNYKATTGQEYYRLRVDLTNRLGLTPDGKRNIKNFYGRGKIEAEQMRDDFLKELDSGVSLENDSLYEHLKEWLFNVMLPARKPATIQRYEALLRKHIKGSEVANMPIKNIRSIDLQKYYNRMAKEGKSLLTIKDIHKINRSFYNYAVRSDYVLKNPCLNVNVPKDNKAVDKNIDDISVFTDEEIKSLLSSDGPETLKNIIRVAIYTGLRQGEILGLNISDVNFGERYFDISKTLSYVKVFDNDGNSETKFMLDAPKSKSSARLAYFPENLIPVIEHQIRIEKEKHLKLGLPYNDDAILFSSETCQRMDARNMRRSFARLLNRAGVE